MELFALLISGSVGAAVVKVLDNVIIWILNRKAKREDCKAELEQQDERNYMQTLKTLRSAIMLLLDDRIRFACKRYMEDGAVDIDDLESIQRMETLYRELGGVRKLDRYLTEIENLPLK